MRTSAPPMALSALSLVTMAACAPSALAFTFSPAPALAARRGPLSRSPPPLQYKDINDDFGGVAGNLAGLNAQLRRISLKKESLAKELAELKREELEMGMEMGISHGCSEEDDDDWVAAKMAREDRAFEAQRQAESSARADAWVEEVRSIRAAEEEDRLAE